MTFEDATRKTYSGRAAGASWYKGMKRVFITLSCSKTGAKTRAKAEAQARKQCKKNGLPDDWKLLEVARNREYPDLCFVIGKVR